MIFVTVGEQLPFDRLIKAVDECALDLDCEIFAQIGKSSIQPENITYKKFIDPLEFNRKFAEAELVIGHAGMGTIISALELATPVIIMPRQASLGEHRNDHQLATSKRFESLACVSVVSNGSELKEAVLALQKDSAVVANDMKGGGPDQMLISVIKEFVE